MRLIGSYDPISGYIIRHIERKYCIVTLGILDKNPPKN
jgi:hypothetical protein